MGERVEEFNIYLYTTEPGTFPKHFDFPKYTVHPEPTRTGWSQSLNCRRTQCYCKALEEQQHRLTDLSLMSFCWSGEIKILKYIFLYTFLQACCWWWSFGDHAGVAGWWYYWRILSCIQSLLCKSEKTTALSSALQKVYWVSFSLHSIARVYFHASFLTREKEF